jgi:hypothetical protein
MKILLLVVLLAIAISVCVVAVYIIKSIACWNCPLKEECRKASGKDEPLPCQNNVHPDFINNQFSNG